MNPPGIITVSWCFNIYKYTHYYLYSRGQWICNKRKIFSKPLRQKWILQKKILRKQILMTLFNFRSSWLVLQFLTFMSLFLRSVISQYTSKMLPIISALKRKIKKNSQKTAFVWRSSSLDNWHCKFWHFLKLVIPQ